MRAAIVLLALATAACAGSPPTPVANTSVCPEIASYTPAEEAILSAELAKLPAEDVLRKVANEDHRLRVELEACRQ